MVIEDEESLKDYYDLLQQYKTLKRDVRDIVLSPKYVLPFLQSGRLVRVQYSTDEQPTFSIDENVTWGIIINFEKVKTNAEGTHILLLAIFSFLFTGFAQVVWQWIDVLVEIFLDGSATEHQSQAEAQAVNS